MLRCFSKNNKNIEFLFNKIIIDLSDKQKLNQENQEHHVIVLTLLNLI